MLRRRILNIVSCTPWPGTLEPLLDSAILRNFDLSFALMNPGPSPFEEHLRRKGLPCHRIAYRSRRDIPMATLELARLIRSLAPSVVHTHLVDASLAGLTAARLCGVSRRIQTRHHSDPHHRRHRHAVVYDRYANALSTEIVAASENVWRVLTAREGVRPAKVRRIPFGVDLRKFESVPPELVRSMRERYELGDRAPLVGVVSRYLEIKGLQYVIPAFRELLQDHPRACLLLANAKGPYRDEIRKRLATLPPGSFREIAFELDMPAFYSLADLVVHVPIDPVSEAFGQVYTEALAAGKPCVFTLSGIAREFIRDGHNAWIAHFQDSASILAGMRHILREPGSAAAIATQGREDVRNRFSVSSYIDALIDLYGPGDPG